MRKINIRGLVNIVGGLLLIEAIFMLIPLLTCVIYKEADWQAFALAAAVTAAASVALRRVKTQSRRMGKREAYLLTASVWVVFSLFGMLPIMLSDKRIDISSAFFEAMSSFTTTGATTLPTSLILSHGMMIWQAMMQWLGGMGIILFTLAIIPALNTSGGVQMFNAEVTGITRDKLRPRISQTALALWTLYLALTVLMAVLLVCGGMTIFDSICHAFGTLSTGGYTTQSAGIGAYNSLYITIIITLFMLLGGINFAWLYRAISQWWGALICLAHKTHKTQTMPHMSPAHKPHKPDAVLKTYLGAIVLFTLIFTALSRGDFFGSILQVVSIVTSTGYVAPNFHLSQPLMIALILVMMFWGGCAGSTSGGAKIDRLLYLKSFVANEIKRTLRPNAVLPVSVNNIVIKEDIVRKVLGFILLYILVIVLGGVSLAALGQSASDAFLTALSAVCNSGLHSEHLTGGEGIIGICALSKWIICALMLIGRLEVYTVLVLFSRVFRK